MSTVILPRVYRLTYADWLRLPDDGYRHELIDGELFVTPTPSIRHQRISRELGSHLREVLRRTGGGEMFFAPTGVRLGEDVVVEPDLLVLLSEHRARIGEQVIEGPPDLVVEVLSPGSARRDLVAKREIYARFGVPEYWIVDSEAGSIEVLALDRSAYTRAGFFQRADTLVSPLLPDLALVLADVFAEAF